MSDVLLHVAVNVAVVAPSGTVTDGGTEISRSVELSVMTKLAGAAPVRVSVPVVCDWFRIDVDPSDSAFSYGGLTRSDALRLVPETAAVT